MLSEELREGYDSYDNSEKDSYVWRPSRERGIHDGFDRTEQVVKLVDVFGVEKLWHGIYEWNWSHGDFETKRSIQSLDSLYKQVKLL